MFNGGKHFMSDSATSLIPYRRSIPQIMTYQVISKGIFAIVMLLYKQLTGLILWNVGRPSFTSGDLPYLMRTWQGWVLIFLGFLALVIYTVFDINATILLSDKLLRDEEIHVLPLLKDAVASLRCFGSIRGVLAILYVSIAAPLAGGVFGITLTSGFTIPNFIMSVIKRNALFYGLYLTGIIILGVIGFVFVFTFDFSILGKKNVREAMKSSKKTMKTHWKNFLLQYIVFSLKWLIPLILVVLVLYIIPCALMQYFPMGQVSHHTGIIFFSVITVLVLLFTICWSHIIPR